MTLRLKDVYDGLVEQEAQMKLAHIERTYEGDSDAIAMLSEALDLLKEAQDKGELPALNESEALSLAVELVEQERLEKDAAAWQEIGETVSALLEQVGIGEEDISKIASDEEAEEFGRFCARLYASHVTGEDLLGLGESDEE